MLDNFDYFRTIKFDKLKERTRKVIPEGMRGLAWMKIAGVKDYKNAIEKCGVVYIYYNILLTKYYYGCILNI